MKQIMEYAGLCLLLCAASCSNEEVLTEDAPSGGRIVLTVAPPVLKGADTRALSPLGPEMENPIKTLSLLVFDNEQLHAIEHSDYYRFFQVADADAPDGQLTFEAEYAGKLDPESDVTLCAVANMDRATLLEAMRQKVNGGSSIDFNQFKELIVDLPYSNHPDSLGLIRSVYMSGYYAGKLKPTGNEQVKISLGRIVSRLNLSLSLSPELAQGPDVKYALRLKQLSQRAYLFPGDWSPEGTYTYPTYYDVSLGERPSTFYYYAGPHAAENEAEATQIEIAYAQSEVINSEGALLPDAKVVSVAICNDPPEMGLHRDFWLNRNSIYTIHIHLKKKGEKSSITRNVEDYYEIEVDVD